VLGVNAEQLALTTRRLAMTLSMLAYVDENRVASQQQMINEINAGLDEAGYKSWQVA
jgi:hypothetical protein